MINSLCGSAVKYEELYIGLLAIVSNDIGQALLGYSSGSGTFMIGLAIRGKI